jgi:hypothetical protein
MAKVTQNADLPWEYQRMTSRTSATHQIVRKDSKGNVIRYIASSTVTKDSAPDREVEANFKFIVECVNKGYKPPREEPLVVPIPPVVSVEIVPEPEPAPELDPN